MRRLEPGEGREPASDGVGLRAPLENVHTVDLTGEVTPNLGTKLEVLADVDAEHDRAFTLLHGHGASRQRAVVGRQELATSGEVQVIADDVATHEGAADLVVAGDVVERLDVVDVQVEAEVAVDRERSDGVEQEAQVARRRTAGRLRLAFLAEV